MDPPRASARGLVVPVGLLATPSGMAAANPAAMVTDVASYRRDWSRSHEHIASRSSTSVRIGARCATALSGKSSPTLLCCNTLRLSLSSRWTSRRWTRKPPAPLPPSSERPADILRRGCSHRTGIQRHPFGRTVQQARSHAAVAAVHPIVRSQDKLPSHLRLNAVLKTVLSSGECARFNIHDLEL